MTATTLSLVRVGRSVIETVIVPTVIPDPDRAARKHADDLAEEELCTAFAKYIERTSYEKAIEALGRELERFAEEAGKFNGSTWLERSRAMFEISTEGA